VALAKRETRELLADRGSVVSFLLIGLAVAYPTVWIAAGAQARYFMPLYPLVAGTIYVNFGFWDVVNSDEPRPPGFLNRRIEREVAALSGIKSLYSDSFYTEDEFWSIYDGRAYRALKARYDPQGCSISTPSACTADGPALNARQRRWNLSAVKVPGRCR
jgi:hypothetical protein